MICKFLYEFQGMQKSTLWVIKVHRADHLPSFTKVGRWEEDKS